MLSLGVSNSPIQAGPLGSDVLGELPFKRFSLLARSLVVLQNLVLDELLPGLLGNVSEPHCNGRRELPFSDLDSLAREEQIRDVPAEQQG